MITKATLAIVGAVELCLIGLVLLSQIGDAIWPPLFGFLGVVVVAFIGYLTAKLNIMAKTVDKIHDLTNSNMGAQLFSNMNFSEFKADTTNKDIDREIAKKARVDYMEHVRRQKIVDDKEAKENKETK